MARKQSIWIAIGNRHNPGQLSCEKLSKSQSNGCVCPFIESSNELKAFWRTHGHRLPGDWLLNINHTKCHSRHNRHQSWRSNPESEREHAEPGSRLTSVLSRLIFEEQVTTVGYGSRPIRKGFCLLPTVLIWFRVVELTFNPG